MAETTTRKTRRHVTSITITDDKAATPLTYAIPVHGELSYTPGGWTPVEMPDSKGDFSGLSPVKGTEQMTTGTIECTQLGLSFSDGAGSTIKDFIDNLDTIGAIADTAGTDPAGVLNIIKLYDLVVVFTDEVGVETLTFEHCTFNGSSYSTAIDDTNKISLSFQSRKGAPTVAFA